MASIWTQLSVAVRATFGPIVEPEPETQWFHELRKSLPRLEGKTIAITGCTSGTGLVLARTCAQLGARVLLLNRPSERAQAALAKVSAEEGAAGRVHHVDCDLTNFENCRAAATTVSGLCKEGGLDVLCCNAGVMGQPDEATKDGCDLTMQANHLGHFLLTAGLWPSFEAAARRTGDARVVQHSSGARNKPWMPLTADYLQKKGGQLGGDSRSMAKWERYQQSKLANVAFAYALDDYASKRTAAGHPRVASLAAHPGPTNTGLQAKSGTGTWLDNFANGLAVATAHSTEDGSMGITICSCQDAAKIKSGEFYGPSTPGLGGPAELLPNENNTEKYTEEIKRMLWDESVATTGAQWP